MSHALIRQLVEKKLSTWAATKNVRIAYENVTFTPIAKETYLESDLTPVDTGSETLSGDHTLFRGIYQVNVICPLGEGTAKANALAAEIASLFPIYQPLTSGTFRVIPLTHPKIMDGLVRDSSYMLPVFFNYRADTN